MNKKDDDDRKNICSLLKANRIKTGAVGTVILSILGFFGRNFLISILKGIKQYLCRLYSESGFMLMCFLIVVVLCITKVIIKKINAKTEIYALFYNFCKSNKVNGNKGSFQLTNEKGQKITFEYKAESTVNDEQYPQQKNETDNIIPLHYSSDSR